MEDHMPREDRGLPMDLEAEAITLGCALLDQECAQKLCEHCDAESFYLTAHQEIFRAIYQLHHEDAPVDPVTVGGVLRERGVLELCGGGEYLVAIMGQVPTVYHLPRYLDTVRCMRARRAGIEAAQALAQRMTDGQGNPRAAFTAVIARLAQLAEQLTGPNEVTTVAEVADTMGRIRWLWPGWVPRGHLTIIAGQPGCGKSALALALARSITTPTPWPDDTMCEDAPGGVLYCDTEGSQSFIVQRAREWGLDQGRVFLPGADGLGRVAFTDPAARALTRRLAERGAIDLIVVDSLRGALTGDENTSDMLAEMLPWVDLAAEHSLGLVVVHHYRKLAAGQRRADLDSVRGSSALVAVARSVISLCGLRGPADTAPRVRMEHLKSNFAPPQPSLLMTMTPTGPVFAPFDAPALGGDVEAGRVSLDAAVRALRDLLAISPRPAAEAVAEVMAALGCEKRTVQRAAAVLMVRSSPLAEDRRQRLWSLPPTEEVGAPPR